jgi:hypothetical protein
MLWSQFWAVFSIFRRKIGAFRNQRKSSQEKETVSIFIEPEKSVLGRAARFYLVQTYQHCKNIPNDHKQTIPNYLRVSVSNGRKISQMVIKHTYQHFPFHGPPKYTQIGIFGMKINHLAILVLRQVSASYVHTIVRGATFECRSPTCRKSKCRKHYENAESSDPSLQPRQG